MKKKLKKQLKSKTPIEMKRTTKSNSENEINTSEGSKNTSNNNLKQQNKRYPSDIQGLFKRLGIE